MGVCEGILGVCETLPYQSNPVIKVVFFFFQNNKKRFNFWVWFLVSINEGSLLHTSP